MYCVPTATLVARTRNCVTLYIISCLAFLFSVIICRLYKLTNADEAQITLPLAVSLSQYSVNISSRIALAGGPEKYILPGPKPALRNRSVPIKLTF